MKKAILSFASGRGKREENVRNAVHAAERLTGTTVIVKSSLYESDAEGAEILTACAVLLTELSPFALFGACKGIEAAMGRVPDEGSGGSGKRVMEIDLLLYEDVVLHNPELMLPHPELLHRPLFLLPLGEIFPDGKALGVDFAGALRKADTERIRTF
jgi:2-amino-4-hydroxy-6-hydroxymethyldihydropteridine diphosphokinase